MRAPLAMLSRDQIHAALPFLSALFAAVTIGCVAIPMATANPIPVADVVPSLPDNMVDAIQHLHVTARYRIADYPDVPQIVYRVGKDQSRFVTLIDPTLVATESFARPEAVSPQQDAISFELPPVAGRDPNDDPLQALAQAREYLVRTAEPGGTMSRQGPEVAVGYLHMEFALRLAAAIREARDAGLRSVGIFSAYRPPIFGVGGFRDKYNSLHAYGLAVDMRGIGRPNSGEAKLWHKIAARHGVVCPYGPANRAEWNHCQPTRLRIVLHSNPLRKTITAKGPVVVEEMWNVANSILEGVTSTVTNAYLADKLGISAVRPSGGQAKHIAQAKTSNRPRRGKRSRYARAR